MKTAPLLFLGMLLLGAAVGWATLPPGKASTMADGWPTPGVAYRGQPPSGPSDRSRNGPVPDTAAMIDQARQWNTNIWDKGGSAYEEEIAGWTDAEIRAALQEALTNRDFLMNVKSARYLADNLLAEWLKRDCTAASEFFLTIPAAIRNDNMPYHLSRAWPPEKAAEGLAFVKAHPEIFATNSPWSIIAKNIEARAKESAASVVRLLVELREAKLGLGFENRVKFPDGFDFASLMKSPEMETLSKSNQGKFFLRAWMAGDRDACYDWILENRGVKSLGIIMESPTPDNPVDPGWLAGRFQQMPAADQQAFREIMPLYVQRPEQLERFAAGIQDGALADQIRAGAARWMFQGRVTQAMQGLAGILDPAARVQALAQASPGADIPYPDALSSPHEKILRQNLLEWNATPEQTEAILAKFKKKP